MRGKYTIIFSLYKKGTIGYIKNREAYGKEPSAYEAQNFDWNAGF